MMKEETVCLGILLTCIILQAVPVMAPGGATSISGFVPLIAHDVIALDIATNSATISWKTNGNATSLVFYDIVSHANGLDYAYRSSESTSLVSEHTVSLNGLVPNTTYHYMVRSAITGTSFIAISNDYTFTTMITVPVLTTISVSPSTASVVVGNTQTFTPSPKDQFGNPISATVTWSNSNTGVGTITSTGVFTAIAPGMTTITATSGTVSGTAKVTVTTVPDTTPPLLIVTQPIDAQVFITNSITVSGTATDASGIANVKVNGILVTISPSGSFSTTVILTNGINTITITATDDSQNANTATVTRTVTFTPPIVPDTTPPLLMVTQPIDAQVFITNSITVSGFATDASGIFSVTVNGAPAAISGDSFTSTLTLNPGTNTITVEAIDSSSNHNRATITRTVTYAPPPLPDTIPPTLVVNQPTNGQVFTTSSIAMSGTATDDSGVQTVSVNGAIIAVSAGPFSTSVFLVPGTNTITVTATDNAGNTETIIRTVTFSLPVVPDTIPPTLIVNQPANGQVFTTNSITVSGTAFDSSGIYSVMVNGNAVPVDPTGSFSATALLTNGSNIITIAATDASPNANTITMTRTVTYTPPAVPDTKPPLLIVSQPADGQVFTTSSIIVGGRATDDSGIRSVTVNGVPVTLTSDGRFGISIDLNIGQNTITVQAIDSSSNLNANIATLTVTRIVPHDTEPPMLVVLFPDEGLNIVSSNNKIDVFGTVSDNTGVQSVTVNGIPATLIGGSFNAPISLSTGSNFITAIAIDNSTNHNSRIITRNITYAVPVKGPGLPSNIMLVSNPSVLEAAGKDAADIVAHVADANGTDVVDGTNIIFTTSDGRLYLNKADADILPGSTTLTAQTRNGRATVVLISSTTPGTAVITAQAEGASASLNIAFYAVSNLKDELDDTTLIITHSPSFASENSSIQLNGGVGSIRTSTAIAIGIVNGTRISYNIGASTIDIVISNPIIIGDQVIFTVNSILLNNSRIDSNFTGIGTVESKVDVRINTASTLIGMKFVMSLHSNIADDLNARGGKDAGLVGSDVILTALQSSLGITDVGKRIAFVTSAQLDGATAQDIIEVPISMTVSGNWYRTMAASTLNNVRLAEIHSNGTVGPIETPESYTYDSVNDSYTFVFSMKGFSTFALIGTIAAAAPSGGGPSGGGGGGVKGEPFDNIAMYESNDKDLIADTPVTYTFKTPGLGVYEIAVTDKENENGITLRVELLNGTSKQVTAQPPGTVYKNINILASTQRMKEALVRFKVENSWLGNNNVAGSDVKMVKWDGSKWVQIEPAIKTKDGTYTYYEAKIDSFSSVAITGLKGAVVPTATPAVEEKIQTTPTEAAIATAVPTEEVKKVIEIEDILSITLVILIIINAILAAVYLFKRKRG